MITYNPIPGRIQDLIDIATICVDYEGFKNFYKTKTESLPRGVTSEIHQYILSFGLTFDEDVKLVFSYVDLLRFFVVFITKLHAYFMFESITSFINWVRHIDHKMLLDELALFFRNAKPETAIEPEEYPTPQKLASFISSLNMNPADRFSLITIFLDPAAFLGKLADAFEACESVHKNISFQFSDYIKEKTEKVYDSHELADIANCGFFIVEEKVFHDCVYSLTFINDFIFHYMNKSVPCNILIGVNSKQICLEIMASRVTDINVEVVGKALGDARRLQILGLLKDGPMYATEIANHLNIAHTSLFYHVGLLFDAKLILINTVGRKTYYSINVEQFKNISNYADAYYKQLTGKGVKLNVEKTANQDCG